MDFDIKKWLLCQSILSGRFKTCAGNGRCVPEYELKNGELKMLKDKKTGEIITHDLYSDIQSDAHVNDYLKILKDNPNALDSVRMSIESGKIPVVNGYDYSQLGDFDTLVQSSQKLKDLGYNSFEEVIKVKKEFDKKQDELKNIKKGEGKKEGDK